MTLTVTPPSTDPRAVLRAGLWMLGAVVSFSSMAVAGRAVSFELDTFEIMMYRSIVGFVLVICVARLTGHARSITTRSPGLHLIRNLSHFTGQNLWFYAITMIPLAQVFALEFTSPLWVLVLSPLILGERLTRVRALAAVIGFTGILIVARPSPDTINAGTLAAAAAAIGFAGSILATKRLTRTETLTCILFWMTLTQIVFGLICAGIDGDIALPSRASAPWLIVIGCAGLMAHVCLTTALSIAPATVITPVDFLRLPLIAVIGLMVYGEAIDAFTLIGAAVIFGANYLNLWHETRKRY
ncbi:Permease of the drug/metabolite transporter (DMT) superfamily [Roseovarius tolerans]|uniref:Permease of the drug/metabolite transporter (DMT) superfamily n=1 Tax=Roseovarius tolerans TaxID=74031 RepID=A0A1H7US07_9RHOB|nr:DMT family transporter [Roseovarius tolerans]SEL99596.1 Permease of the drug/metabolite transporter (DMT) superfamily [Roseovarius tolerans]